MTVPAWIVLSPSGPPRPLFRRFRIIAGPTLCILKRRAP